MPRTIPEANLNFSGRARSLAACRTSSALDRSAKEPLRKLLKRRLDNPHVPGGALHGQLAGYYKIKLKKQSVRLVYGVEDDALVVMVLAVDRREEGVAVSRLAEKVVALVSVAKVKLTNRTG